MARQKVKTVEYSASSDLLVNFLTHAKRSSQIVKQVRLLTAAAAVTMMEKALFTLQEIRPAIVGRVIREQVIKKEEHYFLTIRKPEEQRFYLYESEARQEDLEAELSESVRERLNEAMDADRLVRIVGPVHHHQVDDEEALPLAIDVDELEILPQPEGLDSSNY